MQTLVGVDEQRVGDVEAQRGRREGQALEVCGRKRVGHGHILQAHETAVGDHQLRIVVGVVGALDVFASHLVDQCLRGEGGHIGAQFVAGVEPTVDVTLGEDVEIGEGRVESGVEAQFVARLHGHEEREFPRPEVEHVGESAGVARFHGAVIDEIGLGILRVEEICPGNVGIVTGPEGIAAKVEGGQTIHVQTVEIVGEK